MICTQNQCVKTKKCEEVVDISNNLKSLREITKVVTSKNCFRKIKELNLDGNEIEQIKGGELSPIRFKNLVNLSIINDRVSNVDDEAFKGLKLASINLENNCLTCFPNLESVHKTIKQILMYAAKNDIEVTIFGFIHLTVP